MRRRRRRSNAAAHLEEEETKTKHQAVRQGARIFGMRSILASM
jgi:hypothetical protein